LIPDGRALLRFAALYSALYAGFGAASPFLPVFLSTRSVTPEGIGLIIGLNTGIRLIAGPWLGWMADRRHAVGGTLSICALLAAGAAATVAAAHGFFLLLLATLPYAAMLAPLPSLADALTLAAPQLRGAGRRLEYGWVRGIGSTAFIVGSLLSGRLAAVLGTNLVLVLQAACLLAAAGIAFSAPVPPHGRTELFPVPSSRILELLRLPSFRRTALVAALILGSHALHDSFVMILWSSYDIGSSWGGLLWAESVAAEVIVFVVLGPPIVRSVSSPAVMAIAACAAAARWALSSQATSVSEFALIEPLHGLSFALLHLSCMRIITEVVSPGLLATAQSLYAFAIGASSVVVTLASGWLYARLGAGAFWIMAALPISAAPLIWSLLKAGERQGEQLSSTVVAGMSAPESVMAERSE